MQDAVAAAKSTLMLSEGFQVKGTLRLFGRRQPTKIEKKDVYGRKTRSVLETTT